MVNKIKYLCYLAGAIEKATSSEMTSWRNNCQEQLKNTPIIFYDPVQREAQKTGKQSGEHVKYVIGLKQSGNWEKFNEEMSKIWLGSLKPKEHELWEVLRYLHLRKQIDGNELRDLDFFGDYESVVRADFIIAYIQKDVQTVGTIAEIVIAMLFQIPIYLILDQSKKDANSSLLYFVMYSAGEIFYSLSEACEFLKKKYQ